MTFGQRLKQQREARGIGLEEIAAATKIGSRYLDALERDDFDSLPGDVFTKGYVRAVADFIGGDPDALVEDYMRERGIRAPAAASEADVAVVREMSRVLKSGPRTGAVRKGAARRGVGTFIVVAAGAIALATLTWIGVGLLRGERVVSATPVTVVQKRATPPAPVQRPEPDPVETAPASVPTPTPTPPPVVQRAEPEVIETVPAPPAPVAQYEEPEPEPVEAATPPTPSPAPRTDLVYEPPPQPTRLLVSEYGVGTDIVDHQLVGRADSFREGSVAWFWTRVLRAEPGEKVRHVWIHEGREVSSIELELGSGNWRTQSRIGCLPLRSADGPSRRATAQAACLPARLSSASPPATRRGLSTMYVNLHAGWIAILLGLLVGAGIGIFFHDEDWLGGYASRRRRMLRLGHIALVGTGILNVVLALSADYLEIREGLRLPSILMVVGSATMPAVCFLSAWREGFRHLFFVPVLSLVGAAVLFLSAVS